MEEGPSVPQSDDKEMSQVGVTHTPVEQLRTSASLEMEELQETVLHEDEYIDYDRHQHTSPGRSIPEQTVVTSYGIGIPNEVPCDETRAAEVQNNTLTDMTC